MREYRINGFSVVVKVVHKNLHAMRFLFSRAYRRYSWHEAVGWLVGRI